MRVTEENESTDQDRVFAEMASTLQQQGASLEEILKRLRHAGAWEMQTIKVLVTVYHYPLRDARDVVANSSTWADRRDMNERLQTMMVDGLTRMREGTTREQRPEA